MRNFPMTNDNDDINSKDTNSTNSPNENKTPDLKTLRHLHTDLQHSHTKTLQTFNDISQKSGRLLQFNGTVLAVLAAAATLVESNIIQFIITLSFVGIVLIIDSIFILLWLHKTETVTVGVGQEEREISVGESDDYPPLNEPAYLLWINKYYANWIDDAVGKNKEKVKILYISEVCSLLGIVSILFGTFLTLL